MHDILILCSLIFINSLANSTSFYSFSPNTGGSLELAGSLIIFFSAVTYIHVYMYFYTQVCLHRYMKICKNVLKVILNKTYIEYVTLLITVIYFFF